ncbi:Tctex1 domain-containing protein 2 [Portunus trituberculatus]|uniref:Tctex1 domain-containing protein 2 n=1 Tax=Portunus trituberculatus TaxID=210409 RepID=A0A5B7I4J7_PORTR|nr:Tctex1 domain-containing protein 2 [Portunus trituberculatus]
MNRERLGDGFRPSQVKEVIDSILEEKLTSFVYEKEAVDEMAMVISNALRNRIIGSMPTEMNFPRYKYVVNVVIGELRGAGVKVAARCLWDADTDNYSSSMFVGETFFCTATVFAAYYY